MATFETSLLARAPAIQSNLPEPASAADMYNQLSKIRANSEAIQQNNFLRQAYAASFNKDTGEVDYNTLAQNVARSPYAHLLPQVMEAQQKAATESARQKEQESLAALHNKEAQAKDVELKLKQADQAISDITNFTSLDAMKNHADAKLASGELPQDKYAYTMSIIDEARKQPPDKQLSYAQDVFMRNAMSAKDRYAAMHPDWEKVDLEDRVAYIDKSTRREMMSLPKGMSPYQITQSAIAQQNADIAQQNVNLRSQELKQSQAAANVDPGAVSFYADMIQAGKPLPMGAGTSMRSAVAAELHRRGVSAKDIVSAIGEVTGLTASERTLGVTTAGQAAAGNEFTQMTPITRSYAAKVNMGNFKSLNAIQNYANTHTGDKNIVGLNTSLNSLINIYARAINPKGVATVSDKNHARELIDSSLSKGQLNTVLDVMEQEIAAARAGTAAARQEIRGGAGTAPKTQTGATVSNWNAPTSKK